MDWENLGRRVSRQVSRKGKEVSEKVKIATDVFRLTQQKAEKEANLKEIYAAIGQIFFEEHEGELDDDMIMMFCKVNEIKAEIKKLEEKLQEVNPTKICPDCGASVDIEAQFCSKCGASLSDMEE